MIPNVEGGHGKEICDARMLQVKLSFVNFSMGKTTWTRNFRRRFSKSVIIQKYQYPIELHFIGYLLALTSIISIFQSSISLQLTMYPVIDLLVVTA